MGREVAKMGCGRGAVIHLSALHGFSVLLVYPLLSAQFQHFVAVGAVNCGGLAMGNEIHFGIPNLFGSNLRTDGKGK